MKIRLLIAVSGNDFAWAAGEVVDLPDAEARKWADRVRAELVDESRPTRKRGGTRAEVAIEEADETR